MTPRNKCHDCAAYALDGKSRCARCAGRKLASSDATDVPPPLCVEDAVRANLDGAPVLVPTHGALVAVAFVLARKLDEGAGMATAAVARELRETLDVLLGGPSDDDDGLSAFVDSLRTPMGDPAKP